MITASISDVIGDFCLPADEGYCLYVVRDNLSIFYVGISNDPPDRVLTHLGKTAWGRMNGASQLGQTVFDNDPDSLEWQIDFYTLNDCRGLFPNKPILDPGDAEELMISLLHPYLNRTNRSYYTNPIPEKYCRSGYANDGVKLSNNE